MLAALIRLAGKMNFRPWTMKLNRFRRLGLGLPSFAIFCLQCQRLGSSDRSVDLGLAYTERCLQVPNGVWVIALGL